MLIKTNREPISYIAYHTQEYRCNDPELPFPILCKDSKAWLGTAYYFWVDIEFAHHWGSDFKKNTGYYSIYSTLIEDNMLYNTTFNEEHYFSWLRNIQSLVEWMSVNKVDINLKELHRLLKEKFWNTLGVNGIIYDDLPHNKYEKNRKYSLVDPLYYKKRIQIAIFNPKLINNFELHLDEQPCS